MIRLGTEDMCVGCPQGCIHCGRKSATIVEAFICDKCGNEVSELYDDCDQLCDECLQAEYPDKEWEELIDDHQQINDDNWEKFA